jgi:MFS family permease
VKHSNKETAAEKEKRPAKNWLTGNVFYVGLTSLFSDGSHEMATAILPLFLAITLAAGPLALGIVEGVSDISASFAKPFAGYRSDKTGRRKPMMNVGYVLTGVFIPLLAGATSWFEVLALRAAAWVGRGIRGAPRDALLADSVTPENHGKAFGFHRSMDTLGAIIGPAAALLLLPFLSLRDILLLTAIGGIGSIVVVILKVKEATHDPEEKEQEHPGDHPTFRQALSQLPHRYRLFLVGVGIFGISNFAPTLFSLRAYQLLLPTQGSAVASASAVGLYTLLNVAYAAFSYPIGHLGDRFQKRKLLALGYLAFAAGTLGFAFESSAILFILAALFLLIGFQVAVVDTIEAAYAAELLPAGLRGTGYGALQTINGVGDLMSSAIVALLWTLFSPSIAFGYATILSIMASLALLRLTRTKATSRPTLNAKSWISHDSGRC